MGNDMQHAAVHSGLTLTPRCFHKKKCQGITKLKAIHPQGDMNLCTKFHGKLSRYFTQNFKCEPHGGAR